MTAGSNCANGEIERLAREAMADVSWLAGLHAELHRACVCPAGQTRCRPLGDYAKGILKDSQRPGFEFHSEVAPEEAKYFSESFDEFRRAAQQDHRTEPSDEPGGYLNKCAIVYAVAVAEDFVVRAFKAKFGTDAPLRGFSSIGAYIDVIAGLRAPRKKAYVHISCPPLRRATAIGRARRKVYVPGFDKNTDRIRFVAALRNVIVHNGGYVDARFLKEAGKRLGPATWAEWSSMYVQNKQAWLHIVKVVVPCLRWVFDSIEASRANLVAIV